MQKYVNQKADFYIQSHGYNAGRPLKTPIRNCFAVWTKTPYAFEIVNCLFIAKRFKEFIHCTVIPFMRLKNVKRFLEIEFCKTYDIKDLKKIDFILKAEQNLKDSLEKTAELKIAFAQSIIKQSNQNHE